MSALKLILCLSCVGWRTCAAEKRIAEVFSWTQMDYDYANESARTEAIQSGQFVPSGNVPIGIEIWKNKVFVTVPRRQPGVPSTLNYIPLDTEDQSPLLIPYPNWEFNRVDGGQLVSVYRIFADACDRLWMTDVGSIADFNGNAIKINSPKIVVIDLKTDNIILSYPLKPEDVKQDSSFTNIAVDVTKDTCSDAYAYVTDLGSPGLVVYSLKTNDSWRIRNPYFHMNPLYADLNVGGVNFQWLDGLFGVALSEIGKNGFRNLFFHPLPTDLEFSVSTEFLRNKTAANSSFKKYKILGSRGPRSQASSSGYDEKNGILFYTQVQKNGIGCWNSRRFPREYTPDTNDLVASDNNTMIYPSDLKIDKDSRLWFVTNKLPVTIYGKINPYEVNFRIFYSKISDAIKGTLCENRKRQRNQIPAGPPLYFQTPLFASSFGVPYYRIK